jgi:isocitrate/isopropylmalate dehydrogenase
MMLNWLNHDQTKRGAKMIERAVRELVSDPRHRTSDLGGKVTTHEIGELVRESVERQDG